MAIGNPDDALPEHLKRRIADISAKAQKEKEESQTTDQSASTPEQATGKGGSPINISISPERRSFWRYVIPFAIFIFLFWYSGFYKYIFPNLFKLQIPIHGFFILVGTIIFILYIIWGFKSAWKNKNWTDFFVAWALLIWLIDLSPAYIGPIPNPFGGIPYQGFVWSLTGVLLTDWFAILTSSTFFAFLYINMIYDILKKDYLMFGLGFLFIVITNKLARAILPDFLVVNIGIPLGNILYIGAAIAGAIIVFYIYKKKGITDKIANFSSYLFMAFVFTFFWINNQWIFYPKALLHAIFIVVFGFAYIVPNEQRKPVMWHVLIPAMLILDLYGYGFLFGSDILIIKFIPVLVLFAVTYCYQKTKSIYALTTFVVIVTIILILTLEARGFAGNVTFTPREGGADLSTFIETLYGKTQEFITGRLDIATAGLYRGAVEKNRYESLGVYFANIRAADPRFYTDEPITVWGSIQSKTYKDAVIINFSCYRIKDNRRIRADKIIPEIRFPIFTLEEVDTECTFLPKDPKDKDVVTQGANTITFSAEYNFGTDAYLKAYFMDRNRFRAYARESADKDIDSVIFKEFGIKDTKPVAVHTNGPVEIGLGTGQPLITVSEGYTIKPQIGITLTNRKEIQDKNKRIITKWDGKIKNITELILLTPPGITLGPKEGLEKCYSKDATELLQCPCSMPFKKYELNDCFGSCTEHVLVPCTIACNVYGSNTEAQNNCITECQTTFSKCNDECKFLFEVGEGEGPAKEMYTGYALDVGSLKFKDLNKDIDKHRSFVCRFEPSKTVLDAAPITTRYFRVRARYNYLLENSVTVNVEQLPIEAQEVIPPDLQKSAEEAYKITPFPELSTDYINAIASVESGLRHCCKEIGQTSFKTCQGTTEIECPENRIISSGTSVGIMQIRYYSKDPKVQKKIREDVKKLEEKYCSGKTIFNNDCNMKVGTAILRDKYNSYKNGCQNSQEYKSFPNIKEACDTCTTSEEFRNIPYKSYNGIFAAIRGYNGWGCDYRYDRDYVERVKKAKGSISGKNIINPSTLKEMFPTESKPEGDMFGIEIGPTGQIPLPPPYIRTTYNPFTGVKITWDKSPSSDVVSYLVKRSFGNENEVCNPKSDGSSRYSCTDSSQTFDIGVTYTYTLFTFTEDQVSEKLIDVTIELPSETP